MTYSLFEFAKENAGEMLVWVPEEVKITDGSSV